MYTAAAISKNDISPATNTIYSSVIFFISRTVDVPSSDFSFIVSLIANIVVWWSDKIYVNCTLFEAKRFYDYIFTIQFIESLQKNTYKNKICKFLLYIFNLILILSTYAKWFHFYISNISNKLLEKTINEKGTETTAHKLVSTRLIVALNPKSGYILVLNWPGDQRYIEYGRELELAGFTFWRWL